MNRLELLALLLSLDKLCDKKDLDSVSEVIKELLREARKTDDRDTLDKK